MARPTKFNKALAEDIIEDIAHLIPFTIAAEANQISRATLHRWVNQGLEDIQAGRKNTELAQFCDTIKKKQCDAVKELLNEIKKGEKGWLKPRI